MAKRYRRKKRKNRAAQRRAAARRLIRRVEAVLAVLVTAASVVISVWGGQYGIPTWTQLYLKAGLTNASPTLAAGVSSHEPTKIHFIDVGQGDAVLIEQDGAFALIDCGTEACEAALLAYLDQLGVTELRLLVMTHPHADHIGSMDAVLRSVRVEQLWLPQLDLASVYPTGGAFERVLAAAEEGGVSVRQAQAGDALALGSGTLTVVGTGVASDNYNNISLCLRFEAGSFSFLDTGDAEKEVEQALLESGAKLSATVFKAAHHGSGTSNTLEFLSAVRPKAVVVSCGLNNEYGHPHQEALDHYALVGSSVYRTDAMGSVVVGYAPESGMKVYAARGVQEETQETEAAA